MDKKKVLWLILLNLGLLLWNVALFSPGLIGLTIGADALLTALGVTDIVMSLIGFGWGNYSLLFSEKNSDIKLYKGNELSQAKDYVAALENQKDKKIFEADINTAVEQIYRIEDKDRALDTILAQYFSPQEMTFTKFQSTVDCVQELFYQNLKKMLNRIIIFDYKDYLKVLDKLNSAPVVDGVKVASKAHAAQLKIYNEHLDYVHQLLEMNENMLVKMDSLLLEISKLDDINAGDLENMAAIQEINELIEQTKYYKL